MGDLLIGLDLGTSVIKAVLSCEQELAAYARRGIQTTRAIVKGEILREGDNIAVLRPGRQTLGMHPRHLGAIEGRRAARNLGLGEGIRARDCEA